MAVSASFISMLRSFPMPGWWSDPAQGGGWLNASGSHRIDALRQWFGEVEAVSAGLSACVLGRRARAGQGPAWARRGVDDGFNIRCAMRNGVDAALMQSGAAAGPGASMTRVVGTSGHLVGGGRHGLRGRRLLARRAVLHPPAELVLPNVDALATGPLAEMTRSELPPTSAWPRPSGPR